MLTNILGDEWSLSPEGLNTVTKNGTIKNLKEVIQNVLNSDFKTIGKALPAKELNKTKFGKIVLQIQKVRNIAAPKANETSKVAPRMLKLSLTDGENYLAAIEISPIASISRDLTAPGTKVLIDGAESVAGYLLINSSNCKILGGKVEHLYEKWLLTKSIQTNHQYVSSNGAPPWVAFGREIVNVNDQENPLFKSLDKNNKDGTLNIEFEQQRKDAIAEATSNTTRKTFGGRVKLNAQYNTSSQQNRGRTKGTNDKRREKLDDTDRPQKPTEKLSLFSFLEDKLPASDIKKSSELVNKMHQQQNDRTSQRDYNKKANETKLENSNNVSQISVKVDTNQSANQNALQSNNRNYNGSNAKRNTNYADYNNAQDRKYYNKTNRNNNSYKPNRESGNYERKQQPAVTSLPTSQLPPPPPPPPTKPSQQIQNLNNNKAPAANQPNDCTNTDHNLAANLSRMSINNEFASRSLRQHLNLDSNNVKKPDNIKNHFNVGEQCMAKYWEDGKFYSATITGTSDKTYVVQFNDYGNIEEVLKHDCKPLTNNYFDNQHGRRNGASGGNYLEFRRRGPPRNQQ